MIHNIDLIGFPHGGQDFRRYQRLGFSFELFVKLDSPVRRFQVQFNGEIGAPPVDPFRQTALRK